MKVAISGATGMVGKALSNALAQAGHEPIRIVRRHPTGSDVLWDDQRGELAAERLMGVEAVVHLAGENISEGRWTESKKQRIRASRTQGTDTIARALAHMPQPPRVLVSASAIGYYGDRGATVCDESTAPGQGFLPEVCVAWEAAAEPAAKAGIRVVHPRIGVVLANEGGALQKMLPPFRLGVGGRLGSGQQYFSWITLNDLVRVLLFAIEHENVTGPINAVAPHPVTNREFTKALGRVLSRPTIFPVPAVMARLAFGEMADALLLASTRVVPAALESQGFKFSQSEIEPALRSLLK